jgi:hypothetical protein
MNKTSSAFQPTDIAKGLGRAATRAELPRSKRRLRQ